MKAFDPLTKILKQDARHFQLGYLSSFLLMGIFFLGWEYQWLNFLVIILTCLATQIMGNIWIRRSWYDLKSAGITSLGLCLLCHSDSPWILAFAAFVAIASKFVFRIKGKHIFNPANIGIVLAILLTGNAWISPGQWGQEGIMVLFFSAAGLMILFHVGRLDVGLAFLATFASMLFIKDVLYKGWPIEHWIHSLTNGSLLLFSFFMITDPVSTPNSAGARYLWAVWIAALTFVLTSWWKVYDAPLWALFFSAPLTAVLDRFFHISQV